MILKSAFPHSPGPLLSQNGELRPLGIFNWTIPAWSLKLTDGTRFNACPHAGRCTKVCYALFGKYLFSTVRARHLANLEYLLNHRDEWRDQMLSELVAPRFEATGKTHMMDGEFDDHDIARSDASGIPRGRRPLDHDTDDGFVHQWVMNGGKALRIHDAGDFFAEWYLKEWIAIAERRPHVLFYAYTKEVEMLLPFIQNDWLPANFKIIFSYGGTQDYLIDPETHRHADAFPTTAALFEAGYYHQGENDILAAIAPSNKIGIVANNIPATKKVFDGRRMSELSTPAASGRLIRPEPEVTVLDDFTPVRIGSVMR